VSKRSAAFDHFERDEDEDDEEEGNAHSIIVVVIILIFIARFGDCRILPLPLAPEEL
jgi:hypothetical protein